MAGLLVLCLAALTPQSPPTAALFSNPDAYRSLYSVRLGPASVLELAMVVVVGGWVAASLLLPSRAVQRSAFDAAVCGLVLVLGALEAVALLRGLPSSDFVAFDVERVLLPMAGYVIASRVAHDVAGLRIAALVVASTVAVSAVTTTLRYGLLGSTAFVTSQGREALLITEDSLLVILPVVLLWGALVDGRLRRHWAPLVLLAIGAALVVDALSLRRGALLFILATLCVRSLWLPRRVLLVVVVVVAVSTTALVVGGPLASTFSNTRYALASAVGLRSDASTQQRGQERRALASNLQGVDWLVGRGVGTPWVADEIGTDELAAFGASETLTRRIGWHAYGADWTYKFGVAGVVLVLLALGAALRSALRAASTTPSDARSPLRSLAVVLPPLALLLFTNPRIGCLAGVVLGLMSAGVTAELERLRSSRGASLASG